MTTAQARLAQDLQGFSYLGAGRLYEPPPGANTKAWLLRGGLVDAHAHLRLNMARTTGLKRGSNELTACNWQRPRNSGVLALRDAGLVPEASLFTLPEPKRAGYLLAPQGHCHPEWYVPAEPEALLKAALKELEPADWVKVIADFPGSGGNWFAPHVNYVELIKALVKEVHRAGGRVMAHVFGPAFNDLVDAREHGPEVSLDLLRKMADKATAWIPTLWTVHRAIAPLTKLANALKKLAL